jgi:hypothetical protein
MKKLITVRQAPEDPAWLGGVLGVLCGHANAVDRRHGRAVDGGRMPIFKRPHPPPEAVEELWIIAVFFYRAYFFRAYLERI